MGSRVRVRVRNRARIRVRIGVGVRVKVECIWGSVRVKEMVVVKSPGQG